jgi:hypothetical protein
MLLRRPGCDYLSFDRLGCTLGLGRREAAKIAQLSFNARFLRYIKRNFTRAISILRGVPAIA